MWRGGGSCWVSANEYSCAHGTQIINFGDLTPYLTYALDLRTSGSVPFMSVCQAPLAWDMWGMHFDAELLNWPSLSHLMTLGPFYDTPSLGWYSETGFHIDMDHNFVCFTQTQLQKSSWLISPFLRWSLDLWNQLLVWNNFNLHALISALLITNLFWV